MPSRQIGLSGREIRWRDHRDKVGRELRARWAPSGREELPEPLADRTIVRRPKPLAEAV